MAIEIWKNTTVGTTCYKIESDRLPISFEGFKIAQISDLHNALFGKDNEDIIKCLQKEKPDIIVITGDLIDANRTNIERAVTLV